MPLVDLKSKLTDLKYGSDVRGGGSSGQPFIITDPQGDVRINTEGSNFLNPLLKFVGASSIPSIPNIGQKLRENDIGKYVDAALSTDDFIRGGATGAAQASINDTIRIARFLVQNPKGPIFIAKQVGLQLTNPRVEISSHLTGIGLLDNIISKVNRLVGVTPNRIYNLGINTLAQIPVSALGSHIVRHGFTPFNLGSYEGAVIENNRDGNNNIYNSPNFSLKKLGKENFSNRLLRLRYRFDLGDKELESAQYDPNARAALKENRKQTRIENRIERKRIRRENKQNKATATANGTTYTKQKFVKKQPIDPNNSPDVVDFYLGGPNSAYGIGATLISRYSYTEDAIKYQDSLDNAEAKLDKTKFPINWYKTLGISSRIFDKQQNQQYNRVNTDKPELAPRDLYQPTYGNITGTITPLDKKNQSVPETVVGASRSNARVSATYARYAALLDSKQLTERKFESDDKTILNDFGMFDGVVSTGFRELSNIKEKSHRIGYYGAEGAVITIKSKDWSWRGIGRETRIGDFGPATIKDPKGKQLATSIKRADSINLTPIFSSTTAPDYTVKVDNIDYTVDDLVKFRIEAIDSNDPSKSYWMIFRSLLTQFTDSTDASWNDIKYAGRAERLYVYDGFTRKIQIGFKVAALSEAEMRPMYEKLNYLMGNLMPDMSNGLVRGPLVKMTVGNWIERQPGILNNISYTITQDSPWEVGLPTGNGEKFDKQTNPDIEHLVLPHVIEVSMTFTPIGSQTGGVNMNPSRYTYTTHIGQSAAAKIKSVSTGITSGDVTSQVAKDQSDETARLAQEKIDDDNAAAAAAKAEQEAKQKQAEVDEMNKNMVEMYGEGVRG